MCNRTYGGIIYCDTLPFNRVSIMCCLLPTNFQCIHKKISSLFSLRGTPWFVLGQQDNTWKRPENICQLLFCKMELHNVPLKSTLYYQSKVPYFLTYRGYVWPWKDEQEKSVAPNQLFGTVKRRDEEGPLSATGKFINFGRLRFLLVVQQCVRLMYTAL